MSTIVRLGMRNTMRRRARSLLTAGMVVFAVALLLVAMTWIRGAFGSMLATAAALSGHVRITDRDYAAKEELMPLDEHLERTAPLVELISRQPGVVGAEPRISTGVTVTVGEEIGDVFGLAVGASERCFRERMGLDEKLVEGRWFSGAEDEVIAGAKVAQLAGAKVGDEIVLLGMTQDGSLSSVKGRLVGIVRTGGGGIDQQLFLPLEKLRYLADIPEGATELLVYAASHEQAAQLARRLSVLPELAEYHVSAFSEREPWKSLIQTTTTMQGIVIFIVVFLAALGIWNTMMMSILERTHEIGILRAMGLSRVGAVALCVGEAIAIAVAGGLAGIALGAYPAWLLESKGLRIGEQTASNMAIMTTEVVRGDLTVEAVAIAFGLGVVMALLGSIVPAVRAASIQPVTAMRSGR